MECRRSRGRHSELSLSSWQSLQIQMDVWSTIRVSFCKLEVYNIVVVPTMTVLIARRANTFKLQWCCRQPGGRRAPVFPRRCQCIRTGWLWLTPGIPSYYRRGDELSGLLAGIDRRRTTAVGVTGARGYDTMTTAVLDLLLCMQIFTLLFFNQFWV